MKMSHPPPQTPVGERQAGAQLLEDSHRTSWEFRGNGRVGTLDSKEPGVCRVSKEMGGGVHRGHVRGWSLTPRSLF